MDAPSHHLELLAFDDDRFQKLDPLVSNLLVARSIPSLAHLDISAYVRLRDSWAQSISRLHREFEHHFRAKPEDWHNDVNFFRMGILCEFCDKHLGIAYKEDQRDVKAVWYTDPSDLFLNGVMDTRRGTCGNMTALYVALGWKLGWPVSLACAKSHFVCRFDDGKVQYNFEATESGRGGFASPSDEFLIHQYVIPPCAVASGSDLRSLKPRELHGVFLGLRGRHMRDMGRHEEAEKDYLLARYLFPNSRALFFNGLALVIPRGAALFESGELASSDVHLLARQCGFDLVLLGGTRPGYLADSVSWVFSG